MISSKSGYYVFSTPTYICTTQTKIYILIVLSILMGCHCNQCWYLISELCSWHKTNATSVQITNNSFMEWLILERSETKKYLSRISVRTFYCILHRIRYSFHRNVTWQAKCFWNGMLFATINNSKFIYVNHLYIQFLTNYGDFILKQWWYWYM
jgi:hypothetical protein